LWLILAQFFPRSTVWAAPPSDRGAAPGDLVLFLPVASRAVNAFSGLLTTIVQIFRRQGDASCVEIHAGSLTRNCEMDGNG